MEFQSWLKEFYKNYLNEYKLCIGDELASCLCASVAQNASENDINDNVIFETHLFIICGRTDDIFFNITYIGKQEALVYEVLGICTS
jgi:hypothetical protein